MYEVSNVLIIIICMKNVTAEAMVSII